MLQGTKTKKRQENPIPEKQAEKQGEKPGTATANKTDQIHIAKTIAASTQFAKELRAQMELSRLAETANENLHTLVQSQKEHIQSHVQRQHELASSIEKLTQELEDIHRQYANLADARLRTETELDKVKTLHKAAQDSIAEMQRQARASAKKIHTLESTNAQLEGRLLSEQNEKEQLNNVLIQTQTDLATTEEALIDLRTKERLAAEEAKERALQNEDAEYDHIEKTKATLQGLVTDLQKDIQDLDTQQAKLQRDNRPPSTQKTQFKPAFYVRELASENGRKTHYSGFRSQRDLEIRDLDKEREALAKQQQEMAKQQQWLNEKLAMITPPPLETPTASPNRSSWWDWSSWAKKPTGDDDDDNDPDYQEHDDFGEPILIANGLHRDRENQSRSTKKPTAPTTQGNLVTNKPRSRAI